MTEQQRKLARHALGLNGKRKMSYRNRFYAATGDSDHAEWMAMMHAGQADRATATAPLDCFWLTRKGAEMALNKGEKLDPEDFPRQRERTHAD